MIVCRRALSPVAALVGKVSLRGFALATAPAQAVEFSSRSSLAALPALIAGARGRLDASRKDPVPDARRDLFEAMKQVARTGQGPKDQIPSMGCSIKWKQE